MSPIRCADLIGVTIGLEGQRRAGFDPKTVQGQARPVASSVPAAKAFTLDAFPRKREPPFAALVSITEVPAFAGMTW